MRGKGKARDIARQRIERLLTIADEIYPKEPDLGIKYGQLARSIALRSRVRIPEKWKWRYCKNCGAFLYPGVNAYVRARERRFPHLVIHCKLCGGTRRIPYMREKKPGKVERTMKIDPENYHASDSP